MTFYSEMGELAGELLAEFKQGVIQLKRTTMGAPNPPLPGTSETKTYTLDAIAEGVSQKYVDGTTVIASDLQVTCSLDAVHTHTDGDPVTNASVQIEPQMSDKIIIDGAVKTPKRVLPVPAAGTPAAVIVFVAS